MTTDIETAALAIPVDLSTDPPVVIINGERLDIGALDKVARAASSVLYREITRRKEYAERADTERIFRSLYGDSLVEYAHAGRPILAALWPAWNRDRWPLGLDPATGASVDLEFRRLPASPWGPLWMRPSARTRLAHCWTGGDSWVCGKALPFEYPGCRMMVTPDAYAAHTRSLSLPAASRCQKCGSTT